MRAINLMFVAPHWRVTLVRAFQESWARGRVPGCILGADSDPEAGALRAAAAAYRLPLFNEPLCLNALQEICRKESVHALAPLTNKAVEFLDLNRESLQDLDLTLLFPGGETVAVCHDKMQLAARFSGPDGLAPRTYPAGEVPADARFPLIAKPRRGEGGKDVQRVETRRDLEYWMPRLPDHVFQEWVAGTEFSIDWFATRDGVPRVVSPRERLEVRGGEVMKSRIRQDPQVIAAVTRVGKDLRLAGPATVQGILDKNHRFWLTDVNLRFGSGYVHTLAAGADVPLLIHRELSGGSIADVPLTARDGSVMVRYPEHLLL